jgi:hypothetical protein
MSRAPAWIGCRYIVHGVTVTVGRDEQGRWRTSVTGRRRFERFHEAIGAAEAVLAPAEKTR